MNLAVLKSLTLSGVEWEVIESRHELTGPAARAVISPVPALAGMKKSGNMPMSHQEILEQGRRLATEDNIPEAIGRFVSHPLYQSAKNTVPPHIGGTRLCVVTDMPSLADDASGIILSGADGELFDKMIGAIGLSRADITIVPLVFWRPAGGRCPTAEELAAARPLVDRIIAGAPKVLAMGKLAAAEIAGAKLPGDHGKVFGNVIVTYKPDFIMQNPGVKAAVFEALKLI